MVQETWFTGFEGSVRRVVRHKLLLISLSVSARCERITMSVMIDVIDLSSLKSGERMDRPSYVDGWEERQNKHSRNALKSRRSTICGTCPFIRQFA